MTKVNINGQMVDFDGAVALMDDEIRESVNADFDGETEQDFIDRYVAAHRSRFGAEFKVN